MYVKHLARVLLCDGGVHVLLPRGHARREVGLLQRRRCSLQKVVDVRLAEFLVGHLLGLGVRERPRPSRGDQPGELSIVIVINVFIPARVVIVFVHETPAPPVVVRLVVVFISPHSLGGGGRGESEKIPVAVTVCFPFLRVFCRSALRVISNRVQRVRKLSFGSGGPHPTRRRREVR